MPSRITAAAPRCDASSGMATTPIQPSPIPIAAASHFGAPTQTNLSTIAVAAPAHTTASTVQRHAPARPRRHTAVYVPAISR